MKTKVQTTSIISLYSILDELGDRQKEVLVCLKHIQPCNNLMISRYLNLPINSITPRIKELREKGLVIKHHTGACPITKRASIYWVIKSYVSDILQ